MVLFWCDRTGGIDAIYELRGRPDFLHPKAPETSRYTKEPLAPQTSSTDAPTGRSQRFVQGRDIPQEWWTLFKSPALNALIERSLNNNPSLQSAIATLRAANQAAYAQEGHFFPLVQANFNPTRQLTAGTISPVLNSAANPFNLYTAQLQVSYTFDVWGLNRRTVESLEAQAADQRFQVEAAYLTLTSNVVVAAITEASLRGQIEATNELISINTKMLDILQRQLKEGYANRNDVALQEAALAQVKATLPPLRKALAQQRDLLAALAGTYPSDEPRETFKLANLNLPTELPVSLPSQLIEQRPDVRAAEETLHSASAQIGVAIANMLPNFTISANGGYVNTALAGLIAPQNLFWTVAGNATQTIFDGGTLAHQLQEAKDTYNAAAWSYRGTVIGAAQNVADALRALQNDADALKRHATSNAPPRLASISRVNRCRPAMPTCRYCSPRSSLICRRSFKWCKLGRRGFPTRRLYSRRSVAAGGIAPRRCRKSAQCRHWRGETGCRPPRGPLRDILPAAARLTLHVAYGSLLHDCAANKLRVKLRLFVPGPAARLTVIVALISALTGGAALAVDQVHDEIQVTTPISPRSVNGATSNTSILRQSGRPCRNFRAGLRQTTPCKGRLSSPTA